MASEKKKTNTIDMSKLLRETSRKDKESVARFVTKNKFTSSMSPDPTKYTQSFKYLNTVKNGNKQFMSYQDCPLIARKGEGSSKENNEMSKYLSSIRTNYTEHNKKPPSDVKFSKPEEGCSFFLANF